MASILPATDGSNMTKRIVRSAKKRLKKQASFPAAPPRPPAAKSAPPAQDPALPPNPQILPLHEDDLIRMLMDSSPDRIYFKDRESRFILLNQSTASFFGLRDPSQAVGKTDFDFFSDEHARGAFRDEQEILVSGQPMIGIEEKETWPDGRETWVSTTKLPLRDRAGAIIGTFGVSRDITAQKQNEAVRIREGVLKEANTGLENINQVLQAEIGERKRVEEQLAHERDLFRAMMDNTSDHIYFKDRASRFLLINRAQAIGFGIGDPSGAVGKRDFDFFAEEHAREAYDDEQRIVSCEAPFINKEEKETWPDGHATWVSTTKFPLRDQDGMIIGTFGISRDITERKSIEISILQANEELGKVNATLQVEISGRRRMEEELDRERILLRLLIDNLPDYIFAKDTDGRFTLGNMALARHMGVDKPEDLYGKTDFDFYPADLASRFSADEQALIHSGQAIIEHEEPTQDPAGRSMWTLTTKVILHDSQGKMIGLAGNSRNITERKNMEFAIQLANEKLSTMVNWLEGRNREISVLNEMGGALEACRTPEEAYPVISREMEKLIPVDTGKLYLFNQERGLMECVSRWGSEPGEADSLYPADCRAVESKQVYNTAYALQLRSPCKHFPVTSGQDIAYLCVPLLSQGQASGLLQLQARRKETEQTLPDLRQQLAVMAADHISLALANLTLRETLRIQSIRDDLTGLFNRRYLEESLALELNNTRGRVPTLGVIMLDIDLLKRVNDTSGHEAGDAVLQAVGQWLHTNIRTGDISCRYGGDEFVLILPAATLAATAHRAQEICEGIREMSFAFQGGPLGVMTVSVGVAAYPQHGQTRDALLAAVDAALYKAKEQGRNRVEIAGG
jgi:diguanylate cyclase (GGDEF)-like protein/PAS domain S-box-containing protein